MSAKLPEHDHCKFCGDPVPFDQAYCKEECYWADHSRMQKEKRNNILFAVVAAISVIVIVVVGRLL